MDQQQIIDNLNMEKVALDQSYVKEIQTNLDLRKQQLMKDKCIQDLNAQIQKLIQEKNDLMMELDSLNVVEAPDVQEHSIEL